MYGPFRLKNALLWLVVLRKIVDKLHSLHGHKCGVFEDDRSANASEHQE